jgi:hypothetical protein
MTNTKPMSAAEVIAGLLKDDQILATRPRR